MKAFQQRSVVSTLRKVFLKRLLFLVLTFSIVTTLIISLSYQHRLEQQNQADLSNFVSHMTPRLENQDRLWREDADHVLSIIEWSGLLALSEPLRTNKLNAFFTAQSESIGFEGIVITEASTQEPIFSYWEIAQKPNLHSVLANNQLLWLDEEHKVLYSRTTKTLRHAGGEVSLTFFKEWDSSTLNRLSFSDTESFITLGTYPLISSAGRLALESAQPKAQGYAEYRINGALFHEDSVELKKLFLTDGKEISLRLVVRAPIQHSFPLSAMLLSTLSITLLFGFLMYWIFGRWLEQVGSRLDTATKATLQFQNRNSGDAILEPLKLLTLADAHKHDQISVIAQELSTLMTTSEQRDQEQRAYLQTLDMLQDAVIEFTPDGRLLRATDSWKVLSGKDSIAECGIANCVHPEDSADVLEQISALVHKQKNQITIRFRLRKQDDLTAHNWVEARFASVIHDDVVSSIRGVVRDISSTYLHERQISHMALHDALTDLPNRVLMEDRLTMAITRAERGEQRVALGFIDLDHFKQVNDTFGHKMGDRLLIEVTQRFKSALRSSDTLSRWGGDEFVVLCPDLNSLEDAREITAKLSALTLESIMIDDTEFPFAFSAGFAVYPDDAQNSETLQSQADRAMFYAKAQGRNNIQFFNSIALKDSSKQSFYIQSKLATAINKGEVQAWLQPLVSAQTGKVIGAEVLARWHDAEQGWIPPSVFIPMAESMGLIDKLGQSVWLQALNTFHFLPADHRLSINLSKRQLFSSTIVQQFCNDIERFNIKPEQIMLEVTEGIALSDVDYARERIAELDARGFGIAVDDFGVGYSSLSQLHEIPLDELKLDISFVRRIHESKGLSMATAIVSIAKSLDLECVAEGVEDEQTANLLAHMGVEILQGYHFAKPMPIDAYLEWLRLRNYA